MVETESRGFSLMELLVVTGIFMVLSGIVFAANGRFGNLVVLQNLAHDMALTVRQAQVYGIAVRRYSGSDFDVAYGMHFMLPAEGTASGYELFGDVNDNGIYDPGETVAASTLRGGFQITDICVRDLNGLETCDVDEVNIVFQRPEPDALIRRVALGSLDEQARIVIESNRGDQAEVVVESSGQISVH